jgi:hypothetical protein
MRRDRIGDEHQVELAALGGLRDLGVCRKLVPASICASGRAVA